MRALIFHEKSEKRTSYRLSQPIMQESRGFFMTYLKKMTWEHCVLERMDFFRQNMGITPVLFFNGGFLQNIGMKVMIFLEKSETKGILWTFWFIIQCSFARSDDFLTNYGLDRSSYFIKNQKKNEIRKQCCSENGSYFDIVWA